MVYFSGLDDLDRTHQLCELADQRGLEVGIFTGYMKYDFAFIAANPELSMISAQDTLDQDGLSTRTWGCPWQPNEGAILRESAKNLDVPRHDANRPER